MMSWSRNSTASIPSGAGENVAVTRSGKIRTDHRQGYVIQQMTGTDAAPSARLFGLTDLVEVNPRTSPNIADS